MKNPYRPQDFETEDEQNVEHALSMAWDLGYAAGKENRKTGDGGPMSPEDTALYQAELALTELRGGLANRAQAAAGARELARVMAVLADMLERGT